MSLPRAARPRPPTSVARRARLSAAQLLAWRPSWSWLRASVRSFVTSFLALAASLWLLPGEQVQAGAESVASIVVAVLAVGALLRPLITRLTVLTGVVGLLVSGLLAQAAVLAVALSLVPGVEPFSATEIVLASWAGALAAAVVNWLLDAGSDDVFLGQLLGRAVRSTPQAGAEGRGLLVVQLDGVSEPVLRLAITSGAVPTISRWVRSGSHQLRGWHTGVPATTPAGQAVLLHGETSAVPGFRWYDKERGRLLAVSRPADAAEIEAGFSTGRGLLADGGASVSNLFSGDAPVRLLTVSDARAPGGDRGAASYAALRFGFLRSVTLFVGQVITEAYQGRRQRIRDVVPRVRRGGSFVLLRGLTTVILRDLTVAMVADQLVRGTPVVYVDLVDYDEVAHHAGPTRPESMRTLENLDRVLHVLDQIVREVGRHYDLAVVSDHGQAQGSTFRQLCGQSLEEVVAELSTAPVADEREPGETSIPATMLLSGATGSGRAVTRAARSVAERRTTPRAAADRAGDLVVAVSGSLAHVYCTDLPGRLTRDRLDAHHPRLVTGLAAHPQVGLVLTRLDADTLLVDGGSGQVLLRRGPDGPQVEVRHGTDPLAPYGGHAAEDLLDLEDRSCVGDLVLLGRYDPSLGEVVAFEELVGSHGGLGGWQGEALLLHPADWSPLPAGRLDGVAVHAAMVGRLTELGLRRESEQEVPA